MHVAAQEPRLQTWFAAHAVVQPPQCIASVRGLTHVDPQSCSPAGQPMLVPVDALEDVEALVVAEVVATVVTAVVEGAPPEPVVLPLPVDVVEPPLLQATAAREMAQASAPTACREESSMKPPRPGSSLRRRCLGPDRTAQQTSELPYGKTCRAPERGGRPHRRNR